MQKALYIYHILKYYPLLFFIRKSPLYHLFQQDLIRWVDELSIRDRGFYLQMVRILTQRTDFRNLFYLRCPNFPRSLKFLCREDIRLELAEHNENNYIEGGALFFEHSFSTIVRAKHVGKGCIFRQCTTIGTKATDKPLGAPIIKDHVDFGANIICIGNITIGSHAVIGAGSVVVKDVPDYAIVVGNPARIVGYTNQSKIETR